MHNAQKPHIILEMSALSSDAEHVVSLALVTLNNSFERKEISLPFAPETFKLGRVTPGTTALPTNGLFDCKVLSRVHAEVWAEQDGKVWIRDLKSSNGTYVNGLRLSPENRESEPRELHRDDTLDLGVDIPSRESVLHDGRPVIAWRKIEAKVEFIRVRDVTNGGASSSLQN